ncbi:telomere-associated protein RIF1 isoform X3 [Salmo trutta]|uniref:telomere-associated protein RIF1 isoform X3 n=1 Tax=Salmo trutta TaxID=8032 RepID=UPI0011325B31|nr:telomere-associated protein RIF1-like isoform X3 [Salmo trutta]
MMATVPLTSSSLLPLLESLEDITAGQPEQTDAYLTIVNRLSGDDGTHFLPAVVKNFSRLGKTFQTHISSQNAELSQAALQALGFCVFHAHVVSAIPANSAEELLSALSSLVVKSTDKNTCTRALWVISKQNFPPEVVAKMVPEILRTLECVRTREDIQSVVMEHESLNVIIRLLDQAPAQMGEHAVQWAKLVIPLVVHSASKVRLRAAAALEMGLPLLMEKQKEVSAIIEPIMSSKLIPELQKLFSTKNETNVLKLWPLFVRLLGKLLHRGGPFINSLLGLEELGFRSSSPNIKKIAFIAWKSLIDNFALNPEILCSAKRLKLLLQPLSSIQVRTEALLLTKLEVWWYLVVKLGPNLPAHFEQVGVPLLQCTLGTDSAFPTTPARSAIQGSAVGTSTHKTGAPAFSSPTVMPRLSLNCSVVAGQAYPSIQLLGLEMLLHYFMGSEVTIAAAKNQLTLSLEPLVHPFLSSPPSFTKHGSLLISAVRDSFICIGKDAPDALLALIWRNLVSFVIATIDAAGHKKERQGSEVLPLLLQALQSIISSEALPAHRALSLLEMTVKGIPQRILGSASYQVGKMDLLNGTPALFLILLFYNSSLVGGFVEDERFFLCLETLVSCGLSGLTSPLAFGEAVLGAVGRGAATLGNKEHLWRMWSVVVNPLTVTITQTNEVNQGDALEHNFSAVHTALMFPITHLLPGKALPQTTQKSMLGMWSRLYKVFACCSALVATAEENVCCEELCGKMAALLDRKALRVLSTLDAVANILLVIVESSDFSPYTPQFQQKMKSPHTPLAWVRKKSKALGNLSTFQTLLVQALEAFNAVEAPETVPEGTGLALVSILSTLFSNLSLATAIQEALASLTQPLTALYEQPGRTPNEQPKSTSSLGAKLEKLLVDVLGCLQTCSALAYDDELLSLLSPLLCVLFLHRRKHVRSLVTQFWNSTFANALVLVYPEELKPVLSQVKQNTPILLPGFQSVEVPDELSGQYSSESSQLETKLSGVQVTPGVKRDSLLARAGEMKDWNSKTSKPVSMKLDFGSPKPPRREELEEQASIDFVFIPPETKERVLTEHQKEVKRTKRVDIPAMYNNLDASLDATVFTQYTQSQEESLDKLPAGEQAEDAEKDEVKAEVPEENMEMGEDFANDTQEYISPTNETAESAKGEEPADELLPESADISMEEDVNEDVSLKEDSAMETREGTSPDVSGGSDMVSGTPQKTNSRRQSFITLEKYAEGKPASPASVVTFTGPLTRTANSQAQAASSPEPPAGAGQAQAASSPEPPAGAGQAHAASSPEPPAGAGQAQAASSPEPPAGAGQAQAASSPEPPAGAGQAQAASSPEPPAGAGQAQAASSPEPPAGAGQAQAASSPEPPAGAGQAQAASSPEPPAGAGQAQAASSPEPPAGAGQAQAASSPEPPAGADTDSQEASSPEPPAGADTDSQETEQARCRSSKNQSSKKEGEKPEPSEDKKQSEVEKPAEKRASETDEDDVIPDTQTPVEILKKVLVPAVEEVVMGNNSQKEEESQDLLEGSPSSQADLSQDEPRRSGRRRSRPLRPGEDAEEWEERDKRRKSQPKEAECQMDSPKTAPSPVSQADGQSQGRASRRSKLAVDVEDRGKDKLRKRSHKEESESSQSNSQVATPSPAADINSQSQGSMVSSRIRKSEDLVKDKQKRGVAEEEFSQSDSQTDTPSASDNDSQSQSRCSQRSKLVVEVEDDCKQKLRSIWAQKVEKTSQIDSHVATPSQQESQSRGSASWKSKPLSDLEEVDFVDEVDKQDPTEHQSDSQIATPSPADQTGDGLSQGRSSRRSKLVTTSEEQGKGKPKRRGGTELLSQIDSQTTPSTIPSATPIDSQSQGRASRRSKVPIEMAESEVKRSPHLATDSAATPEMSQTHSQVAPSATSPTDRQLRPRTSKRSKMLKEKVKANSSPNPTPNMETENSQVADTESSQGSGRTTRRNASHTLLGSNVENSESDASEPRENVQKGRKPPSAGAVPRPLVTVGSAEPGADQEKSMDSSETSLKSDSQKSDLQNPSSEALEVKIPQDVEEALKMVNSLKPEVVVPSLPVITKKDMGQRETDMVDMEGCVVEAVDPVVPEKAENENTKLSSQQTDSSVEPDLEHMKSQDVCMSQRKKERGHKCSKSISNFNTVSSQESDHGDLECDSPTQIQSKLLTDSEQANSPTPYTEGNAISEVGLNKLCTPPIANGFPTDTSPTEATEEKLSLQVSESSEKVLDGPKPVAVSSEEVTEEQMGEDEENRHPESATNVLEEDQLEDVGMSIGQAQPGCSKALDEEQREEQYTSIKEGQPEADSTSTGTRETHTELQADNVQDIRAKTDNVSGLEGEETQMDNNDLDLSPLNSFTLVSSDLHEAPVPLHQPSTSKDMLCQDSPPKQKDAVMGLEMVHSPSSGRTRGLWSPLASPSTSILKKGQKRPIEEESPSPFTKSRRVSFADPIQHQELADDIDRRSPVIRSSSPRTKTTSSSIPQAKYVTTPTKGLLILSPRNLRSPGYKSSKKCLISELGQEPRPIPKDCVYPALVRCSTPVEAVLPQITSNMWPRGFGQLVRARNIKTVGDLSALTPSEIKNLPIRSPKISNVKKALKIYHEQQQKGRSDELKSFEEMEKMTSELEEPTVPQNQEEDKTPGDALVTELLDEPVSKEHEEHPEERPDQSRPDHQKTTEGGLLLEVESLAAHLMGEGLSHCSSDQLVQIHDQLGGMMRTVVVQLQSRVLAQNKDSRP